MDTPRPTPTLLDFMAPVIGQTLSVAEAVVRGAPPKSAVDVNRDLFEALRRAREDARKAGKADGAILAAAFAVAAWVDDLLARQRSWYGNTKGLMDALFQGADGLSGTMERLRALPDNELDVRGVIVAVLALGLGEADQRRGQAVADVQRHESARLSRRLAEAGLLPSLTVPETEIPAWQPPAPVRSVTPLIGAGVAAAVAIGAAFVLWPDRPDVVAADDETVELVRLLADGFDCARIDVTATAPGTLRIRGHVQADADRQRLVTAAATIEGVDAIETELETLAWPFCDVASTLMDVASLRTQAAPEISVTAEDGRYQAGDNLVVDVRSSDAIDGYLYVDYYAADGTVIHLLPEAAFPGNVVAAGEIIRIGTNAITPGPLERQWRVAGPLGPKMIVALTVPVPLFPDLRPTQEDASDYLADLREALIEVPQLGGGSDFPADYIMIEAVGES